MSIVKRYDELLTKSIFADKTDNNVNKSLLKQFKLFLKDLEKSKDWSYNHALLSNIKTNTINIITVLEDRIKPKPKAKKDRK